MRRWILIPTSLLLIASSTALAQDKPNIVFMMADNLGYGDVGVYGGGELRGAHQRPESTTSLGKDCD